MDGYAVNFPALEAAAERFRQANNDQTTRLRAMIADVDAAAVNWDGDAKQEWGAVKVTWEGAMSRMGACLTAADQFLMVARQQMGEREMQEAARFSGR